MVSQWMRWVAFVAGGLLFAAGMSGFFIAGLGEPQGDTSRWSMVIVAVLALLAGIGLLAWAIFQRAGAMWGRVVLLVLAAVACVAAFVPVPGLHPGMSFKMAVVMFTALLVLRLSGVLKGRKPSS